MKAKVSCCRALVSPMYMSLLAFLTLLVAGPGDCDSPSSDPSQQSEIQWYTDLDEALLAGKAKGLPVMLEFYFPSCRGCKMMDQVTYTNKDVVAFLKSRMIPLHINVEKHHAHSQYPFRYTPTIIVIDSNGSEQHRLQGFADPERLISHLCLGIAKNHLSHKRFELALSELENLIHDYPGSKAEPEALFIQGLAMFAKTADSDTLEEAYLKLSGIYPNNFWTKKARELVGHGE